MASFMLHGPTHLWGPMRLSRSDEHFSTQPVPKRDSLPLCRHGGDHSGWALTLISLWPHGVGQMAPMTNPYHQNTPPKHSRNTQIPETSWKPLALAAEGLVSQAGIGHTKGDQLSLFAQDLRLSVLKPGQVWVARGKDDKRNSLA